MPLGDRDYYPDMLARQFRNAREAAGLTQTQAAERLLSDQSEISRLETGERRADPSYSIKSCADSGVWQGNGVVMDGDLTVIN